jgi:hypothetical protein
VTFEYAAVSAARRDASHMCMAVLMHGDFSKVMFCMSEWTIAPPRRRLGRNADVVVCAVRACCVSPCTNAAGHSRSGHACHPCPTPRRLRTLVRMRVVVGQLSVWPAIATAAVAGFFRRNTRLFWHPLTHTAGTDRHKPAPLPSPCAPLVQHICNSLTWACRSLSPLNQLTFVFKPKLTCHAAA